MGVIATPRASTTPAALATGDVQLPPRNAQLRAEGLPLLFGQAAMNQLGRNEAVTRECARVRLAVRAGNVAVQDGAGVDTHGQEKRRVVASERRVVGEED